jgi:hypothetical protein
MVLTLRRLGLGGSRLGRRGRPPRTAGSVAFRASNQATKDQDCPARGAPAGIDLADTARARGRTRAASVGFPRGVGPEDKSWMPRLHKRAVRARCRPPPSPSK